MRIWAEQNPSQCQSSQGKRVLQKTREVWCQNAGQRAAEIRADKHPLDCVIWRSSENLFSAIKSDRLEVGLEFAIKEVS